MAKKKKGADDAGKTVERRYYDPAKRPYPRRALGSGDGSGPVANSRQQRRQRSRMSFILQLDLARSQGFPIPDKMPEKVDGEGSATEWIMIWEACYARR